MHPASSHIGAVRAAAMIDAPGVKEHRPSRHLGRFGVLFLELQPVLETMALCNDASVAFFRGEIGHRPNRVELNLEALWKFEKIEYPLIAMNRLRRRAWLD